MTLRWALGVILLVSCAADDDTGVDGPSEPPRGVAHASDGTGAVCGQVKVVLDGSQRPNVMLLVDQSGSMTADFASTDRWKATYQTLMNAATGVVPKLQSTVRLGLALYTSKNGTSNGGTCPLLTEVPMAVDNYAAIDKVYQPAGPIDDTPTAESIDAIATKLAADPTPGAKVIVLATDGYPDTCSNWDPEDDAGRLAAQVKSVAAAKAAFAKGVRIYVISVGDEIGDKHLQDMANAGSGLAVGGVANARFYKALNSVDLSSAFGSVISGVRSCSHDLNGTVSPEVAQAGLVQLDGATLRFGTDWRVLPDQRTLELLGPACDKLLAGGAHQLDATFSCEVKFE